MISNDIRIRYLETTGRCNLNCPLCVDRFRNYDMKQEDFLAIINNNKSILKDNWIWMDFNGEPFLDPLIFDRVRDLKKIGAFVAISTNGLLLSAENVEKIIGSGLDYIVVSVSTLDPQLYFKMRGEERLEEVISNIIQLKKVRDKMGSKMGMQAVAIDVGQDEFGEFKNYFHNLGLDVALHQFTNRGGDSRARYHVEHHVNIKRGVCMGPCRNGLQRNLAVFCNCDVVFCCRDFRGVNVLGNLRDYNYSMRDLVAKSRLGEIISNQELGQYEGLCLDCNEWIYFQENSI